MSEIPLFHEAISNIKYSEFKTVLELRLKTGTYHTHLKPGKGAESHTEMNKDQGNGSWQTFTEPTYNSRAAENLALRETKKDNKDSKERMEKIPP